MAELYNKSTGELLATIPDNELKDIVFASVITDANMDFYETQEGDMHIARELLTRALRDLDTDPLLDSLKRPTLELLLAALYDQDIMEVHFKKDKI